MHAFILRVKHHEKGQPTATHGCLHRVHPQQQEQDLFCLLSARGIWKMHLTGCYFPVILMDNTGLSSINWANSHPNELNDIKRNGRENKTGNKLNTSKLCLPLKFPKYFTVYSGLSSIHLGLNCGHFCMAKQQDVHCRRRSKFGLRTCFFNCIESDTEKQSVFLHLKCECLSIALNPELVFTAESSPGLEDN